MNGHPNFLVVGFAGDADGVGAGIELHRSPVITGFGLSVRIQADAIVVLNPDVIIIPLDDLPLWREDSQVSLGGRLDDLFVSCLWWTRAHQRRML